jgi:uncharacterized protein YjbI with pentapeptide repeats
MKLRSEVMTDQSAHAILLRGPVEWNEWRKQNPNARPDLSGVLLVAADLRVANLNGVNLPDAHLSGAFLDRAQLIGANLSGAKLFRAHLGGTNLSNAELSKADLGGAHLAAAQLVGASLRGCRLRGANLYAADLRETDLTGAEVGRTIFGNLDLSQTIGLEQIRHVEPSTIGIDTFCKSRGKIPVSFLRGAGIPEGVIQQLLSLKID